MTTTTTATLPDPAPLDAPGARPVRADDAACGTPVRSPTSC